MEHPGQAVRDNVPFHDGLTPLPLRRLLGHRPNDAVHKKNAKQVEGLVEQPRGQTNVGSLDEYRKFPDIKLAQRDGKVVAAGDAQRLLVGVVDQWAMVLVHVVPIQIANLTVAFDFEASGRDRGVAAERISKTGHQFFRGDAAHAVEVAAVADVKILVHVRFLFSPLERTVCGR